MIFDGLLKRVKRRKRIFISYESTRSGDAKVIENFFASNNCDVVIDKNVHDSFYSFMDKIEDCDCVVMILNKLFFESVFCTYELLRSYACSKKIYPILIQGLDIREEDMRKRYYNLVCNREECLSSEQEKFFREETSSFKKYNNTIVRLLNEVSYPYYGSGLMKICNEIYKEIFRKEAVIKEVDEWEIRGFALHDLDLIQDIELRSEFIWFIGDLRRCTSFRMSKFYEDAFGEKEWKFKNYQIMNGSIGITFRIFVEDKEGKEGVLDVYDICGLIYNRTSYSENHLRYYFEVYNRNKYKDYLRQLELTESLRDMEIINDFINNGKKKQRISLLYEDGNALENMNIKLE